MKIWLFYNALIPLGPVLFTWVISWLINKNKTIFEIIKDGQVFFYCTATSSVAIGDLQKVPENFDGSSWLVSFIFILILSTVAFAVAVTNNATLQQNRFGWASVATAVATILVVVTFRGKAGLL